MIKVGKILGIMEIFGGFFLIFFAFVDFLWGILEALGATWSTRILGEMVGTGAWWGLASASFSECSEYSECSDDKKVWGGGFGIFFFGVSVFFVNLQKCNVLEEIFEIFLII